MADEIVPQPKERKQRELKPLPERKTCSRCKHEFSAEFFYVKHYKASDGRLGSCLSAECRECHQKPMRRGGIKPARDLPVDSTCERCGETKEIARFIVAKKTAKRGTVSYSVSGVCRDCQNKTRRKGTRKQRKLWDLPDCKKCNKCGEVKKAEVFKVREYKTSTGRDSRKLHSMCDPCRIQHEIEKRNKLKPPKGAVKGPTSHPIDQPKRCCGCGETKEPDLFGLVIRPGKSPFLASQCKECRGKRRSPLEKRREYDITRRRKESADPERLAKKRAWHADNFQQNKERIRLRNMQRRRDRPDIVRARAISSALRRRSFGDDRRIPEIKQAVADALDSYRIGDMYWDVYESKLIEVPTVDHIDPISRGGLNVFENLTVTGLATNSSKGTLPLIVWMAKRVARDAANKKAPV